MKYTIFSLLLATLLPPILITAQAHGTLSQGTLPKDLNGSNFTSPWPVKLFRFTSQSQPLEMALIDVKPRCRRPNGKTAVLLHGKNFCGQTWDETIRTLSSRGYRVIAPDQIGFCKSSKPAAYQFSLSQLAWNTRGLLDALGVDKVSVIGHSMGGMLATRFALQYPESVEELVLVNSVGLEDYLGKGVPYTSIDRNIVSESRSTYESIRGYEQATYYVGKWKQEYDIWVNMLVNIYYGPQRDNFVRNQAQIVDMVLTQPVAKDFRYVKPRTLLIVGEKDNTAIGVQWAPRQVAARLGRFRILARQVAREIPNCHLITFPQLGHAPQISHPDEFHRALLSWLSE